MMGEPTVPSPRSSYRINITVLQIGWLCAGMGNSEPSNGKEQLIDGCDALEELCEYLKLGSIPALATRGSQFYLIRLASLRPDLLSNLVCVSLPWNITPERANSLPLAQRTLFKLVLDAPLAFELACRLGHRMIKKHGPDFYWKRGYNDNEAGLETIRDPEVQPLLRASVRNLIAQGYRAFMRKQEMCVKSPVSDWVEMLQMPMHWLVPGHTFSHGDEDLAKVRALNANITLEVIPDTGELLPFQRPDLFVERLLELAGDDPQEAPARHDPASAINE